MRKPSWKSSDSLSLKFKNPGERFDWSIDRVAIGKCIFTNQITHHAGFLNFQLRLRLSIDSEDGFRTEVVETSVTNNSPSQESSHPNDLFNQGILLVKH